MEWAWGLQGLARAAEDPGPRDTALDRLRGELRGELQSALRLAYLGPKCVFIVNPQHFLKPVLWRFGKGHNK